jgi:hypothetical protein
MADKFALNPQTGEAVQFDGSAWKPVEKSRLARDEGGNVAVYDGQAWVQIGRVGPVKQSPETTRRESERGRFEDLTGIETIDTKLKTPIPQALEAPVDNLATTVRGIGQRTANAALLGGADELVAGVKSAFPQPGQDPVDAFKQNLDKLTVQGGQFSAEHPNLATAAEVAGVVGSPLNLAGGEFITGARGVGGQMLRGGITGTGMGAGAGFLGTDGDIDARLTGAAAGAAAGGALGATLPIAGAAIAPRPNAQVQALIERGVTPTPGQILGGIPNQIEEKIASVVPGVGDMITTARRRANDQFNRAVYNEVLQPMGLQVADDVPIGREGIRTVHQAISDQYNQTLQNVTFAVDQQLNADIQQIGQRTRLLAQDQRQRYDEIFQGKVQDVLQSHGGTLTGPQLQGLLSELRNDVMGYASSTSHNERQLGAALGEVVDAINDSLIRTNPMQAQPLQQANASFARLVRLENAAGSVGNDNGVFTPRQFQSAVKAEDNSARKNQFAQGNALMQELSDAGRAVLADKFPNSGTAGRMVAAGGAATGLAYIEPTMLAALAAGSLPYTGAGGRIAAGLMTPHGPAADAIRNFGLMSIAPGAAAAGLMLAPTAPPPRVR